MSEKSPLFRSHTELPSPAIIPLEGNMRQYSLPEPDENGRAGNEHHDDWFVTNEEADRDGYLFLDLARYADDGTVESRNVPIELFESYQTKVDAEKRFARARKGIGSIALRPGLAAAVQRIRNGDEFSPIVWAEAVVESDLKSRRQTLYDDQLQRIEPYKAEKRRENPLHHISVAKHHPKYHPLD